MSSDEEPDWKATEPDPPSLGPDPPSVDIPDTRPDSGIEAENPEVAGLFWRLVVVFDVAILALALGPMVIFFEGNWTRGGGLLAFGVLVFAYGVARYRSYRADDGADVEDDTDA